MKERIPPSNINSLSLESTNFLLNDEEFSKIKDISTLGVANVIPTVIGGLFWFYIASLLDPSSYGEISYVFSIAGISSALALLGSSNTVTIYVAKKIPLESTLYFFCLIAGITSSIVLFFIFFEIFIIRLYAMIRIKLNLSFPSK